MRAFINLMNFSEKDELLEKFLQFLKLENIKEITKENLEKFVKSKVTEERKAMIMYFLNLLARRD